MSENTDKRNATQKIEDLEKVVTMLYQAVAQMKGGLENLMKAQGDLPLIKDALKLLNKKTEAIIQVAAPETGITVNSVSSLVVKMNVEDLTAQVAGHIASGNLSVTDVVADNSYLVCEELNADGSMANPRIQFRLDSQDSVTSDALKGKKVGDTVSFGDNKFSARILEIYSLVEPKAPDAPQEPTAPTEAPIPTAQVSNDLPTETPVEQFVPSDSSTMTTASS